MGSPEFPRVTSTVFVGFCLGSISFRRTFVPDGPSNQSGRHSVSPLTVVETFSILLTG